MISGIPRRPPRPPVRRRWRPFFQATEAWAAWLHLTDVPHHFTERALRVTTSRVVRGAARRHRAGLGMSGDAGSGGRDLDGPDLEVAQLASGRFEQPG